METTEAPARPALPMDPRIRQRRIAVRRDEGRRRLRVLIAAVAVASLGGAGVAATHSALLDVDHVEVAGGQHTSTAAVVAAAGLTRHTYMIDVDHGAVARRVRALPWVDHVSVQQRWPGTVKITIAERVPVAVAVADGNADVNKVALVDGSGRVLALADQAPAGLLELDGVVPPQTAGVQLGADGRGAVSVVAALPPDVRSLVASVSSGADGIDLHLSGSSAVVQLGTSDQLDAKIVALTTMLAKVDLRGAKTIDVRVPAAPVLTRQGNGR